MSTNSQFCQNWTTVTDTLYEDLDMSLDARLKLESLNIYRGINLWEQKLWKKLNIFYVQYILFYMSYGFRYKLKGKNEPELLCYCIHFLPCL
jgi:hypothetical protein